MAYEILRMYLSKKALNHIHVHVKDQCQSHQFYNLSKIKKLDTQYFTTECVETLR